MSAQLSPHDGVRRSHLLVPLLFAAAVRAVYGWQYWRDVPYARAPVVDAEVYVYLAQNLRAGEWFNPELLYHSFLYPYFLALFPFPGVGANLTLIAAQLALGVINTWLVMRTVQALWRVGWLVLLSGIGFTLTSAPMFFETKLYPEGLAASLVLLVLRQLVAPTRAWTLGLVCGLLVLARSEALLFVPLGLYRVWSADRLGPSRIRRLGGVVAPVVLCLSVAAARNSLTAGAFVPSPTAGGGVVFYFGNNPNAHGGFGLPQAFQGSQGSIVEESRLARRIAEEAAGRPLTPTAVDRYWWRQGLGYLADNPVRALELAGLKLVRYLDARELMPDLAFYSEREELPLLRLILFPFPMILLLALLGFVSDRRERPSRPARDCVALSLIPSLVVCLVFFVHSRYRLSGVLAALLLAPRGVQALAALISSSGSRVVPAGALCVGLVGMVFWAQALGDLPEERAVAQYNEGIAWERVGDQARALAHFARAFEFAAGNPAVRNNYARSLSATGQREKAQAVLEEGLAANPAATELRITLGWVHYTQGRAAEAEQQFREVLQREPADLSAKLSLAFMARERAHDRDTLAQVAEAFRAVAAENHPVYTRLALLGLGMTYGALQQADQIDPVFQRMAQQKPLNSGEESEWGLALYNAGRHSEARRHLERAVELDPRNALAYRRLGLVEQALGDAEAARTHFEQARALGLPAATP